MRLDLSGVNPAPVLPLTPSGEGIHEDDLRGHVADLVAVDGVTGIVTNGHAGEVYALDSEERARVVEIAVEVADDDTPVISGLVGGSTSGILAEADRLLDAGADGFLVVPPHTPISGRRDAAVGFFRDLSEGVDAPLVVFQHPKWAGGFYDPDLLAEIAMVDTVIAVKDAVWDVDHFQEDYRALRDSGADVQLLVANDEHLLPSFSLGVDGAVLELAAVIPEPIIELFEAVEAGEIRRARAVYERMEPFIDAMYEPPVTDSHTRLKVALELQGRIETAVPRRPSAPIPDDEVDRIEEAMRASELL